MRVKGLVTLIPLICFAPAVLGAQGPTGQQTEMKKLDWLVGDWKGTGWIEMGPGGRKEFSQTEKIQRKLDGLVLVIEGEGKAKEGGATVHSALAFVSYDERAKTFRWRAFTAEGRQTDTEAKVDTHRLEWGVPLPQGRRMRYIIERTEKGDWFEIGEMTQDGQKWRKFFEMTLHRVGT